MSNEWGLVLACVSGGKDEQCTWACILEMCAARWPFRLH